MRQRETLINKLERGRPEFAYKCAEEGKKIKQKTQINNEWYQDDKYASYVKKIPQMILSNGLGQTLAFIESKKQKGKNNNRPGSENNPKNAYDLIYKQLTEYMLQDKTELIEWVISRNSTEYRYITQEMLAFLNWLKRFAEGMIEDTEE